MSIKMQRLGLGIYLFVFMSCFAPYAQAVNEIVSEITSEIAPVKQQLVPKIYSAPGYTAALNKIEISSKQSGFITQILVEAGDIVEKNQLLLVIDEAANKQSIEQVKKEIEIAQVTVTDAKKDVNNFQRLRKLQSVSEEKLRKARLLLARFQSTLLQAKAKLIETKAAIPYLRITSPEKALVIKRLADKGDLTVAGSPLFYLEVLRPIIFETAIPVQWIKKIKNKQSVTIKLNNVDKVIIGTISQIITSADPISQKCTVKLTLPSSLNISTGLSGQAQFIIATELLLTVPEKAIIKRVGITGVFRMDNKEHVWFTPVRYGRKYHKQRVILAGLKAQDKIIISPSEYLRDGVQLNQVSK